MKPHSKDTTEEKTQKQKIKLDVLIQDLVLDTSKVNQSPVILQRKRSEHERQSGSSNPHVAIDILIQDLVLDTTKPIQNPVILQRKRHGYDNDKPPRSATRKKVLQNQNASSVNNSQRISNSNLPTQGDMESLKGLCVSLQKSSSPNEVLDILENIRKIICRIPEHSSSAYCSTFNTEVLRSLTLVMKKFSDSDVVRSEVKSTAMILIPKLRLHETSSFGMLGAPFACLLQRENDTLVVDALDLLHKIAQTGKTHIDALLSSRILCKVAQWQFEKLNSDRGRKCWCAKIRKLMSEIIWEISTRGSDRQVATLIDENPVLAKAFVSFLMDMQGETPSPDNDIALDKSFDAFLSVLKKLSNRTNRKLLTSFRNLLIHLGTENCLEQCKRNKYFGKYLQAISKILRFLSNK